MRFALMLMTALLLAAPAFAQETGEAEKGFPIDEYQNVPKGLLLAPDDDTKDAAAIDEDGTDNRTIIQSASSKLSYDNALGLYRKGKFDEAFKTAEPLAKNGNHSAEELVGIMYRMGQGTPKNPVRAMSLLTKAADFNLPLAQHHLGIMYFSGEGMDADPVKGLMWLYIAIAHYKDGPEKIRARQDRDNIAASITRRDRETALSMAKEWLAKKNEAYLLTPENTDMPAITP